jgi:hypothetical protein
MRPLQHRLKAPRRASGRKISCQDHFGSLNATGPAALRPTNRRLPRPARRPRQNPPRGPPVPQALHRPRDLQPHATAWTSRYDAHQHTLRRLTNIGASDLSGCRPLGTVVNGVGAYGCARSTEPATVMHCSGLGSRTCAAPRLPRHIRMHKGFGDLCQTCQEAQQARLAVPGFVRIAGSKAVRSGAPQKTPGQHLSCCCDRTRVPRRDRLGGLIHEYTQVAQGDFFFGTNRRGGPPVLPPGEDNHRCDTVGGRHRPGGNLPAVLDEIWPTAWHHVERYANTGSRPTTRSSCVGCARCAGSRP